MRTTSYAVDLDDVGSVEATVDEHGRVDCPGRHILANATTCSAPASTAALFAVMAYRASPTTAAPDRPRPWWAEHVPRARSVAEVKRDALKPCGPTLPAVTAN